MRTREPYPGPLNDGFGKTIREKWRRRESNSGPAMSQESAGASRRAVSDEKAATCGAEGETASAQESGGESCRCSKVASGSTVAELLELVDAAINALDADEGEVARAQLQALAEAVRVPGHGCGRDGM